VKEHVGDRLNSLNQQSYKQHERVWEPDVSAYLLHNGSPSCTPRQGLIALAIATVGVLSPLRTKSCGADLRRSELAWARPKAERVDVVVSSDEPRLGVKYLPDYELAGTPRNASRRGPVIKTVTLYSTCHQGDLPSSSGGVYAPYSWSRTSQGIRVIHGSQAIRR